jgi:hypothetical protein
MDWADFPHLSAHQQELAEALARGLGDQALAELLASPPEQQVVRLGQFEAFVLAQRAKASERAAVQTNELVATVRTTQEQLTALQAKNEALSRLVESLSSRPVRKKTAVKLDAPKFEGADGNRLTHWLMAVQRAAAAQLIDDEDQMVSFAISNLRGKASEWAYSTLLADADAFPSWQIFQEKIRAMYQPPNNEVLLQGRFFSARQGNRSLQQYVQEMRTLCAAMTQHPLAESVKVPAFMNGLRHGPSRQALFRKVPSSMEEAIYIAIVEEQSFNAGSSTPWRGSGDRPVSRGHGGPTPMELGSAEVVCFNCGKRGHMKARCPVKGPTSRSPGQKSASGWKQKGGYGGAPAARRSGGAPTNPKQGNDNRQ